MFKKMFLVLLALMFNQTVQAETRPDFSISFPVEVTCTVHIPWFDPLCNAVQGSIYGSGAAFLIGCASSSYIMKKLFNVPAAQFKPHYRIQFGLGFSIIGAVAGFYIGLKR